jgi:hypothetical protein
MENQVNGWKIINQAHSITLIAIRQNDGIKRNPV